MKTAATTTELPLRGIKVVAMEHMQAMPYATQLLAYLGAEVTKIEPIETGDSGRASKPTAPDEGGNDVGAVYIRCNVGKRSVALDLKQPAGIDIAHRLVRSCDIFAENMRPGVAERLGMGYDELREISPSLIYASVSGFGNLDDSPYSGWPAFAPVAESMAGLYDFAADPGERPTPGVAGALGDISAAMFAATGILAALVRRDRMGAGARVDISMFDAALAFNDMPVQLTSMGGTVATGPKRGVGVYTMFKASDGYFVVSVIREHLFARFCNAIGQPHWITDSRFSDRTGWASHLDSVIRPIVEEWAKDKSKLEAARVLAEQGIPAGPSNSPLDVIADPHVKARGMVLEVQGLKTDSPVLVVGNPIRVLGLETSTGARIPGLGEHTDQALGEVGIEPDEILKLRSDLTIQ